MNSIDGRETIITDINIGCNQTTIINGRNHYWMVETIIGW